MRHAVFPLLAVAALSAACRPAPEAHDVVAEVRAAEAAFLQSTRAQGAAGWARFFNPDGRMVAGGEVVQGPEAIRQAMEPFLQEFVLDWQPQAVEAAADGTLAYAVGWYRTSLRSRPDSVVERGTYVTVWERQPDGTWRVRADIGSSR